MQKNKMTLIQKRAVEIQDSLNNKGAWKSFLDCASNLYKYQYANALLIYGHKPDATACATFEQWNRLRRYINKGTKGIPIITKKSNGAKIEYVFDISDTNGKSKPKIWNFKEVDESNYKDFLNQLSLSLDVFPDFLLGSSIEENLIKIIDEYIESKDFEESSIFQKRINSLGSEYRSKFFKVLADSVKYTVFKRCNLELKDEKLFEDIDDVIFKENHIVVLGSYTHEIAKEILYEIEVEVKKIVKEQEKNLQNERKGEREDEQGNDPKQNTGTEFRGNNARVLRKDPNELHGGQRTSPISRGAHSWNAPIHTTDARGGSEESGIQHQRTVSETEQQSEQSDTK